MHTLLKVVMVAIVIFLVMFILGLLIPAPQGYPGNITKQIQDQIVNDLITNEKKVSVPVSTLPINRGWTKIMYVGIRNIDQNTSTFKIEFLGDQSNFFTYDQDQFQLFPQENKVIQVKIEIPKDIALNNEIIVPMHILHVEADQIYFSKDILISIRE